MLRKALCATLACALAALPARAAPPADPGDPEVAKGVAQVEEGDYDAAILTLDQAARRLAPDPARVGDLSRAYLYLGVAYLGKGHEAAAKAKFREAVTQLNDLTLSPDQFSPRVINLFESAKEEIRTSRGPTPTRAAPTAPVQAGDEGSHSKKWLLIAVGVVAAGTAGYFLTKNHEECFRGLRPCE